jgi:hypothetical protein
MGRPPAPSIGIWGRKRAEMSIIARPTPRRMNREPGRIFLMLKVEQLKSRYAIRK